MMNKGGVRRDGAFIQKQRIHELLKMLKSEFLKEKWGGQIRLKWVQAKMQFNYGLNYSTTRGYLATLEEMEEITVDDKEGIIMEYYDREALHPTPKPPLQEEGER